MTPAEAVATLAGGVAVIGAVTSLALALNLAAEAAVTWYLTRLDAARTAEHDRERWHALAREAEAVTARRGGTP